MKHLTFVDLHCVRTKHITSNFFRAVYTPPRFFLQSYPLLRSLISIYSSMIFSNELPQEMLGIRIEIWEYVPSMGSNFCGFVEFPLPALVERKVQMFFILFCLIDLLGYCYSNRLCEFSWKGLICFILSVILLYCRKLGQPLYLYCINHL